MAIREVLLSNTFEQQRQLINLIGTDIGDCDNLVTPSNVVTTSINQVVAGYVTLSGQTIQIEDGTLSSPSVSFDSATNLGLYKFDTTTVGVSGDVHISGGLTVDGDITFRAGDGSGGSITFGDLNTDNIVFNADVNSNFIPDADDLFDLGSALQKWRDLHIDGTAFIDTLQVYENATIEGTLAVNTPTITTTASGTTSLFNTNTTTVNAFGNASTINLGSSSGTVTVSNENISLPNVSNISINGADPVISSTSTGTLTLFDQNINTVNAFGDADQITIGAASGVTTTNLRVKTAAVTLDGDLRVNGGEILSDNGVFDFVIDCHTINIGSTVTSGVTTVNNVLKVDGGDIDLTSNSSTISIIDNSATSLVVREGVNNYLTFKTSDSAENITFHKDVTFDGQLNLSSSGIIFDVNSYTGSDTPLQLWIGDSGGPRYFTLIRSNAGQVIFDNDYPSTGHNDHRAPTHSFTETGSEYYALFNNGSVKLYHPASASGILDQKFETTSTGVTINGNIVASGLTLSGDLIVNGSTTTINSSNLSIDDAVIIIADGATTSALADGAGINLGTTSINLTYSDANTSWSSSENFDIADTKTYKINGTDVLSSTSVLGKTPGGTSTGDIVTIDDTQTLTNKTLTSPTYNTSSDTSDSDTIIDAGTYSMYSKIVSFTANRTIQISNLTAGKTISIFIQNTNGSSRTMTIQASTTTSGYANVPMAVATPGGPTQSTVTLAASSGSIYATISNINGTICGNFN